MTLGESVERRTDRIGCDMSLLNSSRAGALLVVIAGACLVRLESPFDPVVWEHVSAHGCIVYAWERLRLPI